MNGAHYDRAVTLLVIAGVTLPKIHLQAVIDNGFFRVNERQALEYALEKNGVFTQFIVIDFTTDAVQVLDVAKRKIKDMSLEQFASWAVS